MSTPRQTYYDFLDQSIATGLSEIPDLKSYETKKCDNIIAAWESQIIADYSPSPTSSFADNELESVLGILGFYGLADLTFRLYDDNKIPLYHLLNLYFTSVTRSKAPARITMLLTARRIKHANKILQFILQKFNAIEEQYLNDDIDTFSVEFKKLYATIAQSYSTMIKINYSEDMTKLLHNLMTDIVKNKDLAYMREIRDYLYHIIFKKITSQYPFFKDSANHLLQFSAVYSFEVEATGEMASSTFIHAAACVDNADIAKLLIDYAKKDEVKLLETPCYSNTSAENDTMIGHGFENGGPALIIAACRNHAEMVENLILGNANIDATISREELAEVSLKFDPHIIAFGECALTLATYLARVAVVKVLVKHGANLFICGERFQKIALEIAREEAQKDIPRKTDFAVIANILETAHIKQYLKAFVKDQTFIIPKNFRIRTVGALLDEVTLDLNKADVTYTPHKPLFIESSKLISKMSHKEYDGELPELIEITADLVHHIITEKLLHKRHTDIADIIIKRFIVINQLNTPTHGPLLRITPTSTPTTSPLLSPMPEPIDLSDTSASSSNDESVAMITARAPAKAKLKRKPKKTVKKNISITIPTVDVTPIQLLTVSNDTQVASPIQLAPVAVKTPKAALLIPLAATHMNDEINQLCKQFISIAEFQRNFEKKPHDSKPYLLLKKLLNCLQLLEKLPLGENSQAVEYKSSKYLNVLTRKTSFHSSFIKDITLTCEKISRKIPVLQSSEGSHDLRQIATTFGLIESKVNYASQHIYLLLHQFFEKNLSETASSTESQQRKDNLVGHYIPLIEKILITILSNPLLKKSANAEEFVKSRHLLDLVTLELLVMICAEYTDLAFTDDEIALQEFIRYCQNPQELSLVLLQTLSKKIKAICHVKESEIQIEPTNTLDQTFSNTPSASRPELLIYNSYDTQHLLLFNNRNNRVKINSMVYTNGIGMAFAGSTELESTLFAGFKKT